MANYIYNETYNPLGLSFLGTRNRLSYDTNNANFVAGLNKIGFQDYSFDQQQAFLGEVQKLGLSADKITPQQYQEISERVLRDNPTLWQSTQGYLSKLSQPLAFDFNAAGKAIGLTFDGQGSQLEQIGRAQFGDKFDITNKAHLEAAQSTLTQMQQGQLTLGDVGKFAIGAGIQGFNMYQQHKANKLAKQQFEEMKALNRANYRNSAKAFNNSLRNQQSGRSFGGMDGMAKSQLGREYNARKVEENY